MMQPVPRTAIALLSTALALAALAAPASAVDLSPPDPATVIDRATDAAQGALEDPGSAAQDPQSLVDQIVDPDGGSEAPGGPKDERDPGFADRIRAAFDDTALVAGVATLLASLVGFGSFALVTRYISPKEALQNPQRAMLYGFVRGNPGVHLKKLSEEFAMKTSSILWHIRKLECAELVRSERANGFRVFYPVEGGIEMKRVSRAITALQNGNARALYEAVERRGGATPADLSTSLGIHGGTVRWHLRKLREFGLVEELVRADGSQVFPTPLGRKALQTLAGAPVEPSHVRPLVTAPVPVLE